MLGSMVSGQIGSALAEKMFHRVGPGGAVLLRMIWAALLLLAIRRPILRGRSRVERLLLLAFGITVAGMNLAFYLSIDHIALGTAVTIEFIGPLIVGFAGSRRPMDVVWVVLAACGIFLLTHGLSGHVSDLGLVFALIAGLFWAAYIVLSARIGRTVDHGTTLTVGMTVACICVLPVGVAQGGGQLLDPAGVALGAAVGALSSAIPYAFELQALRRISTPVFGVLMSLDPAVGALIGLAILGQAMGLPSTAGIGLVVVTSAGVLRGGRIRQ
ncbi:MAG TPA: EamA family transporter [Solirubrobacteraceae bacterium]|nr:EamA family transporter [Solirubrobacteraceae bacterium]